MVPLATNGTIGKTSNDTIGRIPNARIIACVQGSTNGTNGIPISFKDLPMVPMVMPMVPLGTIGKPMVPLATNGIACVRDSPNGTIGNFTNGYQIEQLVTREP